MLETIAKYSLTLMETGFPSYIFYLGLVFYGQTIEMILIELVTYTTEWSIKIDRYIPVP